MKGGMADFQSNCVVDTSVLIDVHTGKIIKEFFKLPYRFYVPDVLLAELQSIDAQVLLICGLQQASFEGIQILQVMKLTQVYRGPSVNDLFALVLAQSLKAQLLTNDANLRKAADEERVVTHGALWVLDELVRLQCISTLQAIDALESILRGGSYLPKMNVQSDQKSGAKL